MNNFGDDQTALVVIIVRPEDGLAFAAADETSADRYQGREVTGCDVLFARIDKLDLALRALVSSMKSTVACIVRTSGEVPSPRRVRCFPWVKPVSTAEQVNFLAGPLWGVWQASPLPTFGPFPGLDQLFHGFDIHEAQIGFERPEALRKQARGFLV